MHLKNGSDSKSRQQRLFEGDYAKLTSDATSIQTKLEYNTHKNDNGNGIVMTIDQARKLVWDCPRLDSNTMSSCTITMEAPDLNINVSNESKSSNTSCNNCGKLLCILILFAVLMLCSPYLSG